MSYFDNRKKVKYINNNFTECEHCDNSDDILICDIDPKIVNNKCHSFKERTCRRCWLCQSKEGQQEFKDIFKEDMATTTKLACKKMEYKKCPLYILRKL